MVHNYQENCILECSSATDSRSDFFTFFLQRMSAGWGRPIWRWRHLSSHLLTTVTVADIPLQPGGPAALGLDDVAQPQCSDPAL